MTQISPGSLDIASDLLAERLRRGPLALFAEPGKECEAQGSGPVEWDGTEIQQMGFDGK